jgi:hypothetical protein
MARPRFGPRRSRPRGSVLDPFKPRMTRWLDTHPYSAQQIFQRLREERYGGGVTILREATSDISRFRSGNIVAAENYFQHAEHRGFVNARLCLAACRSTAPNFLMLF